LVLGRRSHLAIARQVREKFGDLFFRHIARVAFVVVKNEALDPIHVCLLGPNAVVSAANNVPDSVEQFWFVCRRVNRYACRHAADFLFPPDKLKPD
jgi:hypothetical protein